MPSPFPGMNPYLERDTVFNDFQTSAILVISELLSTQLPDPFDALIGEHLYTRELSAEERGFVGHADIAAVADRSSAKTAGIAVSPAPAYGIVPLAVDEEQIPYLEIRDRESDHLLTVIELLSPSNKYAGADREKYLQKRYEIMKTDANLVEIDLLRGGPRLPLVGMPECDYCALVGRATERPRVGIWPIQLRERLPVVPIPLREPFADIRLDLQEMLNTVYDRSGYQRRIYRGNPQPALRPEDASWAQKFVPVPQASVAQ